MKTKQATEKVKLNPIQLCYVVDDVKATVELCEKVLGWGPFNCFTADIESAEYRDWQGRKVTHVALGMAGAVQVEFLHMDEGVDPVAMYQERYGTGLQHIGIHCTDRDTAVHFLESQGAIVNEINEYPGIRFGFMDTPTGDAMFELLQPTSDFDSSVVSGDDESEAKNTIDIDPVVVRRVTIATEDINQTAAFYATSFGWDKPSVQSATLEIDGVQFSTQRLCETAGLLEIEIIQPASDPDCPYRQHLQRGEHGLVHAGVELYDMTRVEASLSGLSAQSLTGSWVETGEVFSLLSWACGKNSLQFFHKWNW